ncbi:hypothetical protein GPECTOR_15g350 [Gonium pectorale]|uniref:Protein kinase domain-containing protein n=1 Tax=Gonium pectorale TaxID=33097 RepID=A0A150GLD1_GONPE|nr:hypothetical protein GPECTOR_15g350 [Gonium pectorale]|eukprot:KXZ50666.1 hypothetical protein GPECTOR_15g350 [Gonium pectorale]
MNHVQLFNCTLLSASAYAALPGAVELLPQSRVWPPLLLHGDEEKAMEWPTRGVPVASHLETDPLTSPLEVDPVASSLEVDPVASPLEVDPVASPLEVDPVASPLEVDPVASPLEIDPVASPLEVDPVASPLEIDPVASPLEVDPVASPLEIDPVASPLEVDPVASPLEIAPVASPLEVDPVASPLEVDPVASPLEIDPVASPLEVDPVASPLEVDPVASPLEVDPVTSPLEVGPVTSPLEVALVFSPVKSLAAASTAVGGEETTGLYKGVCTISGYNSFLVGGRTFTDLKGMSGGVQLLRPVSLRDLVLYNLAPGGSSGTGALTGGLEGPDAPWANSTLPLWYFAYDRSPAPTRPPEPPPLPPPPPPFPPSPPPPPYLNTTREELLAFAAASKPLSYDASTGTLLLASARHYGWEGTNVTITYTLPPDAPPGASLLPDVRLDLPYKELADVNTAVIVDFTSTQPPAPPPSRPPVHDTVSMLDPSAPTLPPLPRATGPSIHQDPGARGPDPPSSSSAPGRPAWTASLAIALPVSIGTTLLLAAAGVTVLVMRRRRRRTGAYGGPEAGEGNGKDDTGGDNPSSSGAALAGPSAAASVLTVYSSGEESACKRAELRMGLSPVVRDPGVSDRPLLGAGKLLELSKSTSMAGMETTASTPPTTISNTMSPDTHTNATSAATTERGSAAALASRRVLCQALMRRTSASALRCVGTSHAAGSPAWASGGSGDAALPAPVDDGTFLHDVSVYFCDLRDKLLHRKDEEQPTELSEQLSEQPAGATPPPTTKRAGASSDLSRAIRTLQAELGGADLEILAALGKGAFGAVYHGTWRGLDVAVKTIVVADAAGGDGGARQRAVLEAAISMSMAHPNVVATYSYELKPLVHQPSHERGSGPAGGGVNAGVDVHAAVVDGDAYKLYIVQELCNGGTLQSALKNVLMVCAPASEGQTPSAGTKVAPRTPHGSSLPQLTAKVADFGLSLPLPEGATHASKLWQGTPARSAPETFIGGRQSPRGDVWSFGLMLIELFYGCALEEVAAVYRSLLGRDEGHGSVARLCQYLVEDMLESPHRTYAELVAACLSVEPHGRPDFEAIVRTLEGLRDGAGASGSRSSLTPVPQ